MKVFLTVLDLFRTAGGGQTVYRKIVEDSPNIEFWYLLDKEPVDAPRPANAHAVPLAPQHRVRVIGDPTSPAYFDRAMSEADRLARSVAGMSFDIVDSPDFYAFGAFIRPALAYHKVNVGAWALSLHGTLSNSVKLNWGTKGSDALELRQLELMQLQQADIVYGVSRRYIEQCRSLHDRDYIFIDPLHFIVHGQLVPWKGEATRPNLYAIGRTERLKGNDIFVELLKWLGPGRYGTASHVGGVDTSAATPSDVTLAQLARRRGISVGYIQNLPPSEIHKLYQGPSFVVLPTRYDTLNLVALEALLSGCPTAVSAEAGVVDYLDQALPNLPYLKLDLSLMYGSAKALGDWLDNYDAHRAELHDYLVASRPAPVGRLDMLAVYGARAAGRSAVSPRSSAFATVPERYLDLGTNRLARISRMVSPVVPVRLRNFLHALRREPRRTLYRQVSRLLNYGNTAFAFYAYDSVNLSRRFAELRHMGESEPKHLHNKLRKIYGQATSPIFRGNFWHAISRIEWLRGQDLMAATYDLRMARILHKTDVGTAARIHDALASKGFAEEARVVGLLLDPEESDEKVFAYLKARAERLRNPPALEWARLDDRRMASAPRVSIVVSLYNAADKLPNFLDSLRLQSMVTAGAAEIILVDSGSPAPEFEAFAAHHQAYGGNIVYARSAERETIQAAWNRGIGLSRAPYLALLGVDETIYPDALETLADELDACPDLDWVVGSGIVTEVDENGRYENDVMLYNRTDGRHSHVLLETTYLSYVGGIYRKSVHDRFGYYDPSFRGAGDTEFKCRIWPHITSKMLARPLGVFLNYPDGQTTSSPMAEIEDSRAWYLFRTLGGVRYMFENKSVEEVEEVLRLSLGYRRTYHDHITTDFEYANLLVDYLDRAGRQSALADQLREPLKEMLRAHLSLEYTQTPPGVLHTLRLLHSVWRTMQSNSKALSRILYFKEELSFQVLNDNRYEQHSWLWRSIAP